MDPQGVQDLVTAGHNGRDEQGGRGHGGAAGGRDAAAIGPAGQSGAVQKKRSSQEGISGSQTEGQCFTAVTYI